MFGKYEKITKNFYTNYMKITSKLANGSRIETTCHSGVRVCRKDKVKGETFNMGDKQLAPKLKSSPALNLEKRKELEKSHKKEIRIYSDSQVALEVILRPRAKLVLVKEWRDLLE